MGKRFDEQLLVKNRLNVKSVLNLIYVRVVSVYEILNIKLKKEVTRRLERLEKDKNQLTNLSLQV